MANAYIPQGLQLVNALTRKARVVFFQSPIVANPLAGFNVYRSDDNIFTHATKLTATPITVTFYEDNTIIDRVEFKTYYYWVTSIDQKGNESAPAGPVWQEFTPYFPVTAKSSTTSIRKVADEFRRRHSIILRNDGEQGHYLCRKVAGPLAVDYDPLRRDAPYRSAGSTSGSLTGAYGTRFQGGYELFTNIRWRFIPVNQRLTKDEMGLTAERLPTMWVVEYPILQPRDIIVRQNNERYVIKNLRNQSIGGRITRQVAELVYLEPQDIIYSFQVPAFTPIPTPTPPTPYGQSGYGSGIYG